MIPLPIFYEAVWNDLLTVPRWVVYYTVDPVVGRAGNYSRMPVTYDAYVTP